MRSSLLAITLTLLSSIPPVLADTYIIDSEHAFPQFAVRHLNFSTLRGRFNQTTGQLSMDREKGTGSVEVVIDANSLDTGHQKRDEHLRGADFFNVKKYPQITYKSTQIHFQGQDKAVVEGELTMKGITKPLILNVERIQCGINPVNKKETCGFDAQGTLKRSDFDIKYGLQVIPDEVQLIISADAIKQ